MRYRVVATYNDNGQPFCDDAVADTPEEAIDLLQADHAAFTLAAVFRVVEYGVPEEFDQLNEAASTLQELPDPSRYAIMELVL